MTSEGGKRVKRVQIVTLFSREDVQNVKNRWRIFWFEAPEKGHRLTLLCTVQSGTK